MKRNYYQKFILFILAIFTLIVMFSCESIFQNSDTDTNSNSLKSIPKSVINAQNDFAMDLFRQINKEKADSNIFISPISVEFALTMTMNGADGGTFSEMSEVLDYGEADLKTINSSCNTLIKELESLTSDSITLNLANSIWYKNSYTLQDTFKSLNQDYFQAKIEGLDFTKQKHSLNRINGWVADKTEGKIKKLVDNIGPRSMMFLINAIYFKADWEYTFDKEETYEGKFNLRNGKEVSCQMMKIKQEYSYYSNDKVQAIDIPYANNNYTMTVILPNAQTDVNFFTENFTRNQYETILNKFEKDSVNLFFPKLKLDYSIELKKALKALGMKNPFEPGKANFSKMFKEIKEGLYISKVKQKSYLNVDETGTEATAATVVEIKYTGTGGNDEIYMRLDQPFLFFIREKRTGTILFSGKIMDPR